MIIAPHGGGIEPGTSEIAKALAGREFSLCCFEGWKSDGNYETLHITGVNFDEPRCVELVERSQIAVAIHGCDDDDNVTFVGGLEDGLKAQVITALSSAGFKALEDTTSHSGREKRNICNRGRTGKGLQLEIAEAQRRAMFRGWTRRGRQKTTPEFGGFVDAVRGVLISRRYGMAAT